ncbi:NAD(P)-dependent oxidoreductase [Aetokthonos hydrillicola Thurmond2011]|jgi:3-hydroxyisobutyrate dehydrogenase-like beta-hydroxyacid dehydrogenase|uniref:NAD(P)-dependent oxidoreductase n=1 Tax=Aetokthonos hydrillicola Thurmond2011 TaxID=2712845 RepID=A0AAP5IDQ1_9CYAN|nr:NAD(P)-dependent oxidoreductase [Aetokthonos hydrillicola]MBO3458634.1 NAD(P)-dependent oxidoreductase [Aetokthonos hydrillicola CCALA 1050]MBW4587987.1 NAD(P)-dependent oxidoreductase [Aetokthonos hydrillicola CCALA 1050]MDR9897060.1 NAD(P)-dependent oxidoreductase [Aetokthonos hydrillicola Thurmond2011]
MERIAYLGLGIMGSGMATNLLKAGYSVTVWNRSPEAGKTLVEQGATQAQTPAQAVKDVDVIMYCLANDQAVEEVVFGQDGIISNVRANQIAINMSTVHPDTSRREATAYAQKQVEFLDAPVFGSKNESAAGGLWIVVGGKQEVFERVKSILEPISETIHYMGEAGKGATMKLIGNSIVATQIEALGEAMTLAKKAGLNPKDVLDVLHVVDFRSPIFDGIGKMLINRDFTPSFALKHMLKDANLIARLAQDFNSPTPAAASVRETIKAAVNQGWGDENASALIKALELEAGVTVE